MNEQGVCAVLSNVSKFKKFHYFRWFTGNKNYFCNSFIFDSIPCQTSESQRSLIGIWWNWVLFWLNRNFLILTAFLFMSGGKQILPTPLGIRTHWWVKNTRIVISMNRPAIYLTDQNTLVNGIFQWQNLYFDPRFSHFSLSEHWFWVFHLLHFFSKKNKPHYHQKIDE